MIDTFLKAKTVADLEGAQQARPLHFDRLFFIIPFCIRMLRNKAQIARESIKNPEGFQGPGRRGLRARVRAHNLLRPPPPSKK